ncbi:MAG: F0F1 ATP synthase subunit B [Bacteroidaceae bacterium]|jgi:F-type H+-transporting ATPase subunit b|nr:F0F1 ATP synthase subunit B [Bacteroidaceae bacterium]MDY6250809.1 F0F1 ATP synthase subunit B [Bacteroidaceae bacterium]
MGNLPSILTPDFGLLFWMLLSFLVVFGLLAKFGFPAIVKAVEERKQYIDESLKSAREANEKLANIKAESEKLLKEARDQQATIIKEAMATREDIIRKAHDEAQAEGAKQLEEAKKQIEVEKENALRQIRAQVADLSIDIAERVVRQQLKGNAQQEQYIERILDEMSTSQS